MCKNTRLEHMKLSITTKLRLYAKTTLILSKENK